jgi:hypothetical protein
VKKKKSVVVDVAANAKAEPNVKRAAKAEVANAKAEAANAKAEPNVKRAAKAEVANAKAEAVVDAVK